MKALLRLYEGPIKALVRLHLRDIRQRIECRARRLTKLAALALQAGGVKVSVFVLFLYQ